jgi:hypothetical protein
MGILAMPVKTKTRQAPGPKSYFYWRTSLTQRVPAIIKKPPQSPKTLAIIFKTSQLPNTYCKLLYISLKQSLMIQEPPPPVQLMQLLFGFAVSRAIGVCAELHIADLLKDGAKTAEELAQQTSVHARSLYRVLRACASVGVFSEDTEKRFSLTPLAEPLLSDAPGSLRAFAEMITTDWQFRTWAELPYSVKTGKPSFEKVHGLPAFDYFWSNEKAGRVFNDAMTSNSAFSSVAVVNGYDFSSISVLADVGGGIHPCQIRHGKRCIV